MAILQVGSGLQLRAASTGSKEEDYENDAATIVQKCVGVNSQEDNLIVFVILLILRFSSFQQLEIYEMIGQAISNSRRAGGEVGEHFATDYITLMRTDPCLRSCFVFQQHYQNFQLLGAWCLLNSLYLILNLSPTALADKGKEKDPLAALRVRDIATRTKDGAGSPKLGPGKG